MINIERNPSACRVLCAVVYNATCYAVEAIYELAKRIFYALCCTSIPDSHQLMHNNATVPSCQYEWMLNTSLLGEINKEAQTEQERASILFLANNFLNKGAPTWDNDLRKLCHNLSIQVGGWNAWHYHRMSIEEIIKLCEPFTGHFLLGKKSPLILTDTLDVDATFTLKFCVLPSISSASFNTTLVEKITSHISAHQFTGPTTPFLLDLTDVLTCEEQFELVKQGVLNRIETSIDRLVETSIIASKDRDKLRSFIHCNMTCICRVQDKTLCGIKLLPIFSDLNSDNVNDKEFRFLEFARETGLLINPLNLRRHLLNAFEKHPHLAYAIQGEKPLIPNALYPQKKDFTQANFYLRATDLIDSEWGALSGLPHIAVLGKATVKLLNGLMQEISDEQWAAISSDGVKGSLFQLSLFKIQEHLGRALLNKNDFSIFTQEIELIHAEFPTFFELFSPFDYTRFSSIYEERMRHLMPATLSILIKGGLGKSACTVFSEINEILLMQKPNAVRVHCENFYFEQRGLIGEKHEYHAFMATSNKKVDLYVGQFSPNIELDPAITHYRRNDVASHINQLLTTERASEHLTIAIDCTIDQFYSGSVKGLLATFEQEIISGRLNFIFFQSGVKFNLFGMDNYYGAPFLVVNNRQAHWSPFDRLHTHSACQTDLLSSQWFSLAYTYAPDELATYRKLIFDNTRAILNRIAQFSLQGSSNVRIATVDPAMDACFIDIKIFGYFNKLQSYVCFTKFYYMLRSQGATPYSRASFGFARPNFIIIAAGTDDTLPKTIRINPGINPEDNEAIVAYLAHITNSTISN